MLNLPLPFVFSYVVSNKLERLGELLPLGNLNRFCPCFSQPGGTCPALVALLGNLDWVGPQPGRTCPDRCRSAVIGERYWGTWNGSVPNLGGPALIKSGQVPQPDPIGEHTFPYGYAFWQTGKLAWAELGDLFYPRKVTSAMFSF